MCNEGPGKELGEMRGEGEGGRTRPPRPLGPSIGLQDGGRAGAREKARRGRGPFLGAPEGHSPAPDFHNPSGARSKLLTSEL